MSHVLEPRYAYLDELPSSLVRPVVRHVHGELRARSTSVSALRTHLLDGRLPDPDVLAWPEPTLRDPLLAALGASGVIELCEANPELTEDVLLYILDAVHEAHRLYERGLVSFAALKARERCLDPGSGHCAGRRRDWRALFDTDEWSAIQADAMRLTADVIREMLRTRTQTEWEERADLLAELAELLRELTSQLSLPPGVAGGFLRRLSRDELLRLRTVLSELEPLADLIARLGRGQETDDPDAPTVLEQIGALIERDVEEVVPEHDEGPIDLRGVERSGEIARMLPSEAALMRHPVLRKLWRARWVERSLATYHARGVLTQRIQTRTTFEEGLTHEARRMRQGPVIAILDTSGSMWGSADRIAKAVAMQIASTAFLQSRPCYVYNFSGNGDLVEHELGFDGDGIVQMLAFLSLSFGGGTQPDEALRRAMDRLESKPWRRADLVMLSDGMFGIGAHITDRWRALKRRMDARAIGIRVGVGDGFDLLPCDEVHDLGEWTCMLDVGRR